MPINTLHCTGQPLQQRVICSKNVSKTDSGSPCLRGRQVIGCNFYLLLRMMPRLEEFGLLEGG